MGECHKAYHLNSSETCLSVFVQEQMSWVLETIFWCKVVGLVVQPALDRTLMLLFAFLQTVFRKSSTTPTLYRSAF